ncbi:MAG: DedA family protein [Alphaproteobacteria bacterium]|nr:DedA family protein [Alphaproteobacteria bacterium]
MIRDLIRNVTGYPGLFLLCTVSGLAVPLPEDFALLYAGMHVAEGRLAWSIVVPLTIVGVGVRDLLAFGLGRVAGEWILARSWGRRLFGGDKRIAWARSLVDRHGDRAVLIGRFVVGFRAPIFMVGGAMGLSARRFVLWDGMGLLVAVPLTLFLGFHFGQPVVDLTWWVLQRARIAVATLALIGASLWLWRILRSTSDSED